jgi:hypothetical protein
MISSGDNETHEHPRAKVIGWSGAFSRLVKTGGSRRYLDLSESNYKSPLIYTTELARSSRLWDVYSVLDSSGNVVQDAQIKARGRKKESPHLGPVKKSRKWLLADQLVYGLVNVRTDGEKFVIAVMNEGETKFQCESFEVPS